MRRKRRDDVNYCMTNKLNMRSIKNGMTLRAKAVPLPKVQDLDYQIQTNANV